MRSVPLWIDGVRRTLDTIGISGLAARRALESLRDDVPFARALAAGRRLGVLDRGEVALELGDQLVVGAAGEHLGDEGAARAQALRTANSSPASTSAMVRRWSVCGWPTVFAAMSERTRSAGPPSASFSCSGAASSMKSICRMATPSIGSVGSRSMPTIVACGDSAAHDLAPAARRDAEVDDRLHALQQAEPLVELEQFVGGAAAVILGLGALDVGVVELPLEPARRARLAALAVAALDPPPSGRGAAQRRRGARHELPTPAPPLQRGEFIVHPSRAISERRMPSRMPRSATPEVLRPARCR